MCPICWWEDDGQDDSNADVVCGGPNGELSLTDGGRHFAAYQHCYDEAASRSIPELVLAPKTLRARIAAIQALENLKTLGYRSVADAAAAKGASKDLRQAVRVVIEAFTGLNK